MLSSSEYKKSIGKNGYTFLKNEIRELNIKQLKKDLTVFPKVCQNYAVENEPVKPVILYQENKEKIYIPRYYAIEKFGLPQKTKIQKPITANLNFSTTLRPHQNHIVDCYLKNINDEFGGGGAGEFGAIIWQAKLEGALLIADATLAGVGAGALLSSNPSPTIVSNFDSITTDFGSNPKPS